MPRLVQTRNHGGLDFINSGTLKHVCGDILDGIQPRVNHIGALRQLQARLRVPRNRHTMEESAITLAYFNSLNIPFYYFFY